MKKIIKTTIIITLIGIGAVALYLGEVWVPKKVEAKNEIVNTIVKTVEVVKPLEAPVLERICKAESGGNQFCTAELAKSKRYKDCYDGRIGMPLMNINKDGTSDWGFCQINDWHWGSKARELGFDIMAEEGNKKMAQWIYLNHGTDAWNASKANWK